MKLAASYLQTGDVLNGLREQVRAADLLPANNDAQIEAGNLLLLAGRFEDAKARATRVIAADASNVNAQILLGNALAGLKDLDGAINEVEEALKLDPDRSARTRVSAPCSWRRGIDRLQRRPSSVQSRNSRHRFRPASPWGILLDYRAGARSGKVAASSRERRTRRCPSQPRVRELSVGAKRIAEAERSS